MLLNIQAANVALAGPIVYGGGNGERLETAIVVLGAINEQQGIVAETAYVARTHPEWRSGDTTLLHKAGRFYDSNVYLKKDGSESTLIFDVTEFYGRN